MDHQAAIGHADRLIRGKRKGEEGSAIGSRVKCAHVPDIPNNASGRVADAVSNEGTVAVALGIIFGPGLLSVEIRRHVEVGQPHVGHVNMSRRPGWLEVHARVPASISPGFSAGRMGIGWPLVSKRLGGNGTDQNPTVGHVGAAHDVDNAGRVPVPPMIIRADLVGTLGELPVVVGAVHHLRKVLLLDVVDADGSFAGILRLGQGGQQQGSKDGDDSYHHQQFN